MCNIVSQRPEIIVDYSIKFFPAISGKKTESRVKASHVLENGKAALSQGTISDLVSGGFSTGLVNACPFVLASQRSVSIMG
jgi:hypothetical protein